MSAATSKPPDDERVRPGSIAGWWHDHANLAALYTWLCQRNMLDTTDVRDVAYFLSKPWKWSVEYREMISAGEEH